MPTGLSATWYRSPYSISTITPTTAGVQYLPFWVDKSTTFDRIAIRTVTLTTSGTMYLAIYNDSTSNPGQPGTIKLNAGSVSVAASNTLYSITISQTLDRGWYWLAGYYASISSTFRGYGAYDNGYWVTRTFGDPGSGSPYDAFCPALFGGTSFADNPTTGYYGYSSYAIFLRTS